MIVIDHKRVVLPEKLYDKFDIASTICSLIETSYPEALYYINTENVHLRWSYTENIKFLTQKPVF